MALWSAEIRGIEDLNQAVAGADLEIVPLAPGPLQGRLFHAPIDTVCLSAGEFGSSIRARGLMNAEQVTIGMMLETDGCWQWSWDTRPGDAVLFPSGSEQEGRFIGRSAYATVSLPVDRLAALFATEPDLGDPAFWSRIRHCRPPIEVQAHTARIVGRMVAAVRGGAADLPGRGAALFGRAIVEAFATGILMQQPERGGEYPESRLIRSVEDLVRARSAEPLHISQICAELGVSRRSLQRAFARTLGIGPATYLRNRRLGQVRTALQRGDGKGRSIASLAFDHGFWDSGRFARAYRAMFGEMPSETRALRQRSAAGLAV
ncbi:helix-turn-helix transcriptional regulator [Labrys wisconsinensis]|uniref:AraC family ethanolamine operon transcriptional activator n=1 Tax=Labrys wisconsinensis TaxID=425677 RepID=A0ABU0J5K7_9HYPH|nr:AraC family transcriptional regulator [Labrys wisconsinensis]MDQ0468930.1 AraC family ethanolamine operon transcriptional activator [Labrys wisconsinensis]